MRIKIDCDLDRIHVAALLAALPHLSIKDRADMFSIPRPKASVLLKAWEGSGPELKEAAVTGSIPWAAFEKTAALPEIEQRLFLDLMREEGEEK